MEAPFFFWDVPDYINYAGIGLMIAHELIYGFDETGIRYNGTQRQTLEGYEHLVQVSECLTEQYRAPQSLKAASGLLANFTVAYLFTCCVTWELGRLPLNEILVGSGAVRLVWEAYGQFFTTFIL
ncbi:Membrane metallo-endopeptidase-like 1 [Portunus trituberculatus]|uniref:Membrane metallo-endopeptidase-like 1 n=1 Tax=Portunus trituberculatus TaxID=210409 RepID=A0A5B7HI41_PORTR|nr:Membrane metallo-endopeptidase-like 1 [Portunus trituberculatus]